MLKILLKTLLLKNEIKDFFGFYYLKWITLACYWFSCTDEELSPTYEEARGEPVRDAQQERHAGLVNMHAALQAQLAQQLAQQQAALATAIAAAAAHHHHQNNNVIGECLYITHYPQHYGKKEHNLHASQPILVQQHTSLATVIVTATHHHHQNNN